MRADDGAAGKGSDQSRRPRCGCGIYTERALRGCGARTNAGQIQAAVLWGGRVNNAVRQYNIVGGTVALYNDLSLNDTSMDASDRKPPLFLTITASKQTLMESAVSYLIEDVDAADDDATRARRARRLLRNLSDRLTNILQSALNTAVKSNGTTS